MIIQTFEEELLEQKDAFCRYECPHGKSYQSSESTEAECYECGNTWEQEFEFRACDSCQMDEFIRYIRDLRE